MVHFMVFGLIKDILMKDSCIYKNNMPTTMKLGIHTAPITSIKILRFGFHRNILTRKCGIHGNKIKHIL